MNEPIKTFKDIEEANECKREWQKRLGLSDWVIKVKLQDCYCKIPEENSAGYVHYEYGHRAAVIDVYNGEPDEKDLIKMYAETILVHELIHCVMAELYAPDVMNLNQERVTESLARALILAKYDLPHDWFDNTLSHEQLDNTEDGD